MYHEGQQPTRTWSCEPSRRVSRQDASVHILVEVIHNASIMNAIGACGLQLYRYGEAVSIVFFTDTWKPDSFYDKIAKNRSMGLHTLCLLDIKVKEPNLEQLCRGRTVYEEPRYMTVNQVTKITQLIAQHSSQQQARICIGH
eukprot:scaffold586511_cov43-Prasinocladus_malaysianus.AAC.1